MLLHAVALDLGLAFTVAPLPQEQSQQTAALYLGFLLLLLAIFTAVIFFYFGRSSRQDVGPPSNAYPETTLSGAQDQEVDTHDLSVEEAAETVPQAELSEEDSQTGALHDSTSDQEPIAPDSTESA